MNRVREVPLPADGLLRVVLVDADEEVRDLLDVLFQTHPGFRVVGHAFDGPTGVAVVTEASPDVVVLELELPSLDGLAAIPLMREAAPECRIVVFSVLPDPYTLLEVLARGADAYVDKGHAWAELLPTISALVAEPTTV